MLRRCTFGVRPADVDAVRAVGIEAWIERQLQPETLPDPDVERRLSSFSTLGLTTAGFWREAQRRIQEAGPEGGGPDVERRRQEAFNRFSYSVAQQTQAAVLIRAVHSERQLFEVLVDFWRNHLNVDVSKDDVRYYVADWEREVLRRHALGRFEDLLLASAQHPAMLFYLDNHVSQAPAARGERVLQGRERAGRTEGLNENYARELMELHTVGVDNGYVQEDVIQLALVLTGWTIEGAGDARGNFVFREGLHARGRKRVMGKTVAAGGVEEGLEVVRHLARHRNTRDFVCRKLVRHFVADEPPAAIVEAASAAWARTRGDLREVVRTILLHPEFHAPAHVTTKAKTPLEFVASALRVVGADVTDASDVLERLADMVQPLYQCEDPTGYSDRADDWMDPGVFAVRWRFAHDLLHGRLPGVDVGKTPLWSIAAEPPEVWEHRLVARLLAGQTPGGLTMAPFRQRLTEVRRAQRKSTPAQRLDDLRMLATLLLGSPEFQRQ